VGAVPEMIDWRFILAKHILSRKWAFGYMWTWNTHISDSEDFNDPIILKNGTDMIDAGACFGTWAIRASPYYRRIFALEPFPENYKALVKNIEINRCGNITPLNVAVAGEEGEARLFSYGDHAWGEPSLLKEHMGHSSTSSIMTSLTTIDSLVDRYDIQPSIIKIDVEGAENEAILGAKRTITKYHPGLVIEVHTPDDPRRLVANYVWKESYRYLNGDVWSVKDDRQLHLYGTFNEN
jgi:FkbM family methyltransferase